MRPWPTPKLTEHLLSDVGSRLVPLFAFHHANWLKKHLAEINALPSPLVETEPTAGAEEVQVVPDSTWVLPSEKVPVAVNCLLVLMMTRGLAGVIAIDFRVMGVGTVFVTLIASMIVGMITVAEGGPIGTELTAAPLSRMVWV